MRKPRTELNLRQNPKKQQTVQQSFPDSAEGRIKSPADEFMEKDEVIKLELVANYFSFFCTDSVLPAPKNVTEIKCTKWLSIDLTVQKKKRKER